MLTVYAADQLQSLVIAFRRLINLAGVHSDPRRAGNIDARPKLRIVG